MTDLHRPKVTLGGVALAATSSIAWRFQAGVQPYVTTMSVYHKDWEKLKGQKGKPITLSVTDSRGKKTDVRELFILYEMESVKPNLVSFRVADRRWRWHRRLIARVYNIRRKTGDKDLDDRTLPLEGKEGIPKYNYRPYSLQGGEDIWTARDALEDTLDLLENKLYDGFGGKVIFSSFPASDMQTLENVIIRDSGDVALELLLSKIPGAGVWVNKQGHVIVYNQHDLAAAESYLKNLPLHTWDGDKSEMIDKKAMRPSRVIVHYEREVECLMHYEDDYDTNSQLTFKRDELYLENVVQTVDPQTTITEYNPETGKDDPEKTVGPGTWVNFEAWLKAMDKLHGPRKIRGARSWNFNTMKRFWLKGNLEGLLIPPKTFRADPDKADVTYTSSLAAVQAMRESWRQDFRISRRYVHRVNQFKDVRVALIDPVSGIRMPASVWGQMALVPTAKGSHIASRAHEDNSGVFYNITHYPDEASTMISKRPPGPQKLTFKDQEAGIIRISGMDDPYGAYSASYPFHVVDQKDKPASPVMALQMQDEHALGAGMRLDNATAEIWARSTMKMKVMISIVPGSPNNRGIFHTMEVDPAELKERYPQYRIQEGTGPELHIYVPPNEATARFGWRRDEEAEETMKQLLGLDDDDPSAGGLVDAKGNPTNSMPGFWLVNEQDDLWDHSRSMAAEAMVGFADTVAGKVATIVPPDAIELKGNMRGATLQVAPAPSGKVNVSHEFGGDIRPVDRRALMTQDTRKFILGVVRFE